MTLITYPTRVHFADDVLEEALHSELDRANSQTVLLLCDKSMSDGELADRVMNGLPSRISPELVAIPEGVDLREIAQDISRTQTQPDTIIAFGSSQAIELARKVRFLHDQSTGKRPSLFAVPAIDGLPDPCNRNLESKQAGLPSVVICDPTVILNAGQDDSLKATVMNLTRCIEAYLSVDYNPPADGMALEGLSRCLASLDQIGQDKGLQLYREVMAAGLNAFLSQEKGVGPAQTMTASLLGKASRENRAAIARLVLPGALRARDVDNRKADVLRKVLSVSDGDVTLADATQTVLSDVGLPRTLACG